MDGTDDRGGKDISLVLGAGGARGLAHIGAIEALEEAGYEIRAIAGSSMGAVIGGIYAAGKLDDYRAWVTQLTQTDVFKLVDWTFSGGGLIRGEKLIAKLEELVGRVEIESLPIDFTAVTVDIDQGREVWLSTGPLFDAVRASIAIPGLFTPQRYRGRTLIDGGILNPVPVAPTLRCLTTMTVVVNANGLPLAENAEGEEARFRDQTSEAENGILGRIRDFISGLTRNAPVQENAPGLLAVLLRSLEIMELVITRQHLAVFQPDLVIEIPKNACMIHEFHRARELIELGRQRTRQALKDAEL